MDKEILTLKDFAKEIHYSERSVRQMCIDGRIEAQKIDADARKWLIPAVELERLKAGNRLIRKDKQDPYEETPHKKKMRELAKTLAEGINLPSLEGNDLWKDLPLDFQPGKYSLPIGVVEIAENGHMKVSYYDIGVGNAQPHLVKGLFSHLSTSGLSKFAELAGAKSKLDDWVGAVGQYSEALMTFLKLIADEVKGYRAKVSFNDDLKPGLTKWFIATAWYDAIQKASGYPLIDYKPQESIPGRNLLKLSRGVYPIGIHKSDKTLETYEDWHKKLRLKYVNDPLVQDIDAKSKTLNYIAQDIRQRLQEFSDMQHLLGHCELC
ncbi:MAG: helix-turn-helix domain-containing protein [Chloroflexi bacterium]|nr:helix-turn-helix domain-containing protein [Chloroflexota bacterium]